jgi:hypothetical protein
VEFIITIGSKPLFKVPSAGVDLLYHFKAARLRICFIPYVLIFGKY